MSYSCKRKEPTKSRDKWGKGCLSNTLQAHGLDICRTTNHRWDPCYLRRLETLIKPIVGNSQSRHSPSCSLELVPVIMDLTGDVRSSYTVSQDQFQNIWAKKMTHISMGTKWFTIITVLRHVSSHIQTISRKYAWVEATKWVTNLFSFRSWPHSRDTSPHHLRKVNATLSPSATIKHKTCAGSRGQDVKWSFGQKMHPMYRMYPKRPKKRWIRKGNYWHVKKNRSSE